MGELRTDIPDDLPKSGVDGLMWIEYIENHRCPICGPLLRPDGYCDCCHMRFQMVGESRAEWDWTQARQCEHRVLSEAT
jgi:hypothetical protein